MSKGQNNLAESVRSAIAGATTEEEVLTKAVTLIDDYSNDFHWTGFYMMRGKVLEVGPFIGPPTEHTRIELNRGICGAAATQKRSIIVDDVLSDPRFLACSVNTRSEIVVPLLDGETVLGEIDIDSNRPAAFTADDRIMLEKVAAVIVQKLITLRRNER